MNKIKKTALEKYFLEPEKIGIQGLYDILDQGHKWQLADTLSSGGSAIFPHTYLCECGHQIAAVVHGCLDSGADQILVLGVLHCLSDAIISSMEKEKSYLDISKEPFHGVFGPGSREEFWGNEYSLFYFKVLFDEEVNRRGIKPPKLIMRYPFLVNRQPENLPGIEELAQIAKDSAVVATGDCYHHGKAYGSKNSKEMNSDSLQHAEQMISQSFKILKTGDYRAFYSHCLESNNDSINTCTVLRHLLGPMEAEILDIKLVNSANLFEGDPTPSWVSPALISLQGSP